MSFRKGESSCDADDDSCAHVSAALNLVTSLLKVADIEEVQLLSATKNKAFLLYRQQGC
jgi:hypothetical protein